MNPPEASMVLQAMDPDDRVDILLEHVTGPLHDELLHEMAAAAGGRDAQPRAIPARHAPAAS